MMTTRPITMNWSPLSSGIVRKTWESWLVSSYPERFPEIVVSQGHTTFVAVNHYLGLPFDRRDKEEMSEWVNGWEK